MFRTEHLEGRSLYETDEVVCMNVFGNRKYSYNTNDFLSQILLSLVNGKDLIFPVECKFPDGTILTREDFIKEVNEGIEQYRSSRKRLGLSK